MRRLDVPWPMDKKTIQSALNSDISKGLSSSDAEKRLKESGLKITE